MNIFIRLIIHDFFTFYLYLKLWWIGLTGSTRSASSVQEAISLHQAQGESIIQEMILISIIL